MGIIRSLFGWMQANPHQGDHPALYPLDFEDLIVELDVIPEARRMGVLNSPSSDKTTLSSVEMRIKSRIEEYRHKVMAWSQDHVIYLNRTLAELDVTKDINRAHESAEEFKRAANDIISQNEHELHQYDAEAKRLGIDLELFKAANGLVREPKKPMPKLIKVSWHIFLFFLVIVEGALNANFFADGLDGGFIDGLMYAIGLSALNVYVGFILGFRLKHFNHVSVARKASAAIALFLAIGFMLLVALSTTHMRDAFGAIGLDGKPMALALQTLRSDPLHFSGLDSVLMFIISCVFSIAAWIKGYTWGDHYPGYSAVSERVLKAREVHDEKVKDIREDLTALKAQFLENLEGILETAARDIVKFKEQVGNKAAAGERRSNYLVKAEHMLNALIEKFRGENALHRKEPAPAYFNDAVQLTPIPDLELDMSADLRDIERQEALLDDLLERVEPLRGEIQSAFVLCYDQVTPLREHLKSA